MDTGVREPAEASEGREAGVRGAEDRDGGVGVEEGAAQHQEAGRCGDRGTGLLGEGSSLGAELRITWNWPPTGPLNVGTTLGKMRGRL